MKKVYIWGTGVILARVLDYRIKLDEVIAFVDNDENKVEYLGKKVIRPKEVVEPYDAIVIATTHAQEVLTQSLRLKLNTDKFIFLYNNILTSDINSDYSFVASILGQEYAEVIRNRYKLVRNIARDEIMESNFELTHTMMYKNDYVRVKALELAAQEINTRNVCGSIAELGVFKGEFSRCLNILFPLRDLFLFDTFDGFGEAEAEQEKGNGTCKDAFLEAFKNVNIESVLIKMKYPQKIHVRRGLFPQTAEGLENEKYAFVSLDVDFEDSTYKGLEYFYPRLSEGGYIFIHDYNYGYFDAIRQAVDRYEREYGIHLCKVPIPDAIGTIIIVK